MIAVVLSLKDLGYTVASYYGAGLTVWAGIEPNDCGLTPFDNLWLLYGWRIICRLMPVAAILLIPTEEQITDTMELLTTVEEEGDENKKAARSRAGESTSWLGASLTAGGSVPESDAPEDEGVETVINPTAGGAF